jgi:hypothetical protein
VNLGVLNLWLTSLYKLKRKKWVLFLNVMFDGNLLYAMLILVNFLNFDAFGWNLCWIWSILVKTAKIKLECHWKLDEWGWVVEERYFLMWKVRNQASLLRFDSPVTWNFYLLLFYHVFFFLSCCYFQGRDWFLSNNVVVMRGETIRKPVVSLLLCLGMFIYCYNFSTKWIRGSSKLWWL